MIFQHITQGILLSHKYDKLENSYDYLLSMDIRSFTSEKLEKLKKLRNDKDIELKTINNTNIKQMWINDLHELNILLKNDNNIN